MGKEAFNGDFSKGRLVLHSDVVNNRYFELVKCDLNTNVELRLSSGPFKDTHPFIMRFSNDPSNSHWVPSEAFEAMNDILYHSGVGSSFKDIHWLYRALKDKMDSKIYTVYIDEDKEMVTVYCKDVNNKKVDENIYRMVFCFDKNEFKRVRIYFENHYTSLISMTPELLGKVFDSSVSSVLSKKYLEFYIKRVTGTYRHLSIIGPRTEDSILKLYLTKVLNLTVSDFENL